MLLAEYPTNGLVPHLTQFVDAAVSLDSIDADGIPITGVLPVATFTPFCTGEVIYKYVSLDTVTAV